MTESLGAVSSTDFISRIKEYLGLIADKKMEILKN